MENDNVYYTPKIIENKDYSKEYFTIVSLEDSNEVSFSNSILYQLEESSTWNTLKSGKTLVLNTNQEVKFKLNNPTISSSSGIGKFSASKKFNVCGNIMSLLYGDDFIDKIELSGKNYIFKQLFYNCTNIVEASKLVLPATILANNCYYQMFYKCTSLTTVPELPATILANYCYYQMFYNCSSLTTAPKLSAITLSEYCYAYMFDDCTSLTIAPELSATTLASGCYSNMFKDCSNLTTAPELPATTLVEKCYNQMFYGCSNLNHITMLATDISASDCLKYWVQGVSRTGIFVKNENATWNIIGGSGIPEGWTVINEGGGEKIMIPLMAMNM